MTVSPQGNYIFEVQDWRGRTVRLTKRTFEKHEKRHPEFAPYIEEAKQTIQDPDFVAEADNGAVALFRFGLGHKPFENLFLEVIVYYSGEEGIEATHHFTTEVGGLQIIEHRYQWLTGTRFDVRGK